MPGDDDRGRKGGIRGDEGRAGRLAAELRANLVRRKSRARRLAANEAEAARPETGDVASSPATGGTTTGAKSGR